VSLVPCDNTSRAIVLPTLYKRVYTKYFVLASFARATPPTQDCETDYCESNRCWPDDVDADDFGECDEYFCGNDPYWRYDAGDKGLLGCDDIAGEPEKIENRCRTQERIGVDAKGREVRASYACKGVCRFECEGC